MIYTMNATEEEMKQYGFGQNLGLLEMILQMILGTSESLHSFDTCQFKDYSKVVGDRFDPEKKERRRREVFPKDCEKAFQMGVRFAEKNG